jgi:hypothetical protein
MKITITITKQSSQDLDPTSLQPFSENNISGAKLNVRCVPSARITRYIEKFLPRVFYPMRSLRVSRRSQLLARTISSAAAKSASLRRQSETRSSLSRGQRSSSSVTAAALSGTRPGTPPCSFTAMSRMRRWARLFTLEIENLS